jgi:hypothetical protein
MLAGPNFESENFHETLNDRSNKLIHDAFPEKIDENDLNAVQKRAQARLHMINERHVPEELILRADEQGASGEAAVRIFKGFSAFMTDEQAREVAEQFLANELARLTDEYDSLGENESEKRNEVLEDIRHTATLIRLRVGVEKAHLIFDNASRGKSDYIKRLLEGDFNGE